jgi:hypothetical protein
MSAPAESSGAWFWKKPVFGRAFIRSTTSTYSTKAGGCRLQEPRVPRYSGNDRANVRIVVPDLDDELELLTMKAPISETQSKSYASNAEKLSGITRPLSAACLQLDADEVERLEKKMDAFRQKLRETVIRRVIDKIKLGRRELMGFELAKLQELTKLQAAQKWASHDNLGGDHYRPNHERVCTEADAKLQRVMQHQVPELDAHIQAVQSNAHALVGMSVSLLSRATEAGSPRGSDIDVNRAGEH